MQHPSSSHLATAEYEFICDDGPDYDWAVAKVFVSEALNRPYQAIIDLECATEEPKLEALLGLRCELVFMRGFDTRRVYGVISRAEHLGTFFVSHQHIRLTVVSAFGLLEVGQSSRIWQDVSVQTIVEEVLAGGLGHYGGAVEIHASLSGGSSERDYCVQYRESDFAFVSRLLAEEGISYCFEHRAGDGHETLALRDENHAYPSFEGLDGEAVVPYVPSSSELSEPESIQQIGTHAELGLTHAARREYDWRATEERVLEAERGEPDTQGGTRRHLEHGQRRFVYDDQEARLERRMSRTACEGLVLRGRSNVTGFAPGLRFQFTHPRIAGIEGEFLLTRVVHEGAGGVPGQGRGGSYSNEFECVPISSRVQPCSGGPKPLVHGPQTALVVGDEEIHTDEFGRVQVQFHWEEGPTNEAGASCWIRCSQALAGLGWGALFLPRQGMEVVVEFLEGDPDRPLITGCVYNGKHSPPVSLPEHKTQSTIRTSSMPGGEGYHELRFEDAAGAEYILLRSQRDWLAEVLHDRSLTVGNDEIVDVGKTRTVTIGEDYGLDIGGAWTTAVAKTCSHTIEEAYTLDAETVETSASDSATHQSGGDTLIDAGAKVTICAGGAGKIEVSDKLELICGGSKIVLESGGTIKLEGSRIKLRADKISSN